MGDQTLNSNFDNSYIHYSRFDPFDFFNGEVFFLLTAPLMGDPFDLIGLLDTTHGYAYVLRTENEISHY
jgi:hypothetical protein